RTPGNRVERMHISDHLCANLRGRTVRPTSAARPPRVAAPSPNRPHFRVSLETMNTPAWWAITLLAFAACVPGGPSPDSADPPNVVLIISDDHGWTDYGFMDHPVVRTPNLDRLAAESLV